MEIYLLPAAATIIVVLFILLSSKPKFPTTGLVEFNQVKDDNEKLKISLAKAEERAENLKSEHEYLKRELNTEREKLSEAMRSLESSRAYLQAQQEKIEDQKSEIKIIRKNSTRILN